jgi:hypothetical protein
MTTGSALPMLPQSVPRGWFISLASAFMACEILLILRLFTSVCAAGLIITSETISSS